jgi:hypothetical protein
VRVSGFLLGSCWFHAFYIGVAVAELQAKQWSGYLKGNRSGGIGLVSRKPFSPEGTCLRG